MNSPSRNTTPDELDQVDYVSGRSRVLGIVGHPIEQVRSPERVTAELRSRGLDAIEVSVGPASARDADFLMNATPSAMLGDTSLPLDPAGLAPTTVVFDAVVTPAVTPLLAHAERVGCVTVYGREMMRGQIAKLVDFFTAGVGAPPA